MSDEAAWSDFSLPEVLDFKEGPGILAKDFRSEGVPLIRLAGLKYGADLLEGCNYLDPDMVTSKWSHFQIAPGDVLLSTSASLGEVAIVGEEAAGAIPYTGIIRFRPRDSELLDSRFIRYVLESPQFKTQVEAMGVGSVVRHFGPSHLKHMAMPLPPVTVQRSIADVLCALDDKVAANRRLIEVTNELSQASFRKMLNDSEPLPLSSTAQFVNGKAFTKGASGTGRLVVRIAELNSGIGGSTVFSDIDVEDQYLARPGDILFAWSGSLTLHRWFREEAIVNQHIFKVIPHEQFPDWLVYRLIEHKLPYYKEVAADKATTMGHIQRKHLDEPVEVPSRTQIVENANLMSALWKRMLIAEQESEKLSVLRDTLLPRLMSGELRVKDAEAVAADAV
ncbi:restriction endonuclease subunit S [Rhodococcus ruber]|uniref:Restriction modification system DNA specificity domain protein n=1 Tax=Rhodococcus ruber TaxID=1830 RepID=A0A098BT99_9NOCA|nr:restriction endonuclease subunit S [Rhodococcus ruber]MCD2128392.1 restriction endonuclease subunit S [Rhodococcus ruber]MCZ4505102.1 restriction endonuclease subunit S [Rhodococcus ruber]MCZ4531805.1 restriction endonuclease subunit S [Rhodococcus ruber]MCZ4622477.1 restriction endonuclease subunit S [Rhodococcus ruber]MDI9969885.1 restriction endonuclease subunit S [Rhodococcus ruber]